MKGSGLLFFLILVVISTACSTLSKQGTATSDHSENISRLRPDYGDKLLASQNKDTLEKKDDPPVNPVPQQDVTGKLDEVLAHIIKKNEDIDYAGGYTIQVYSGASRENADMVKSEIYKQLPTSRPKVEWVAPNYQVRVGSFLERIEAQKSYSELKEYFPQAILIPTKILNTFPLSKY